MKTSLTRRTYTTLPADPLSVSLARTYVTRILADWGHAELTDDTQLVVSELLTNAIKAARDAHKPNDPTYAMFAGYECNPWLGLHQVGDGVALEVWDCNRNPPKLRTPESGELGGRGLQVVNDLATSWGYRWPKTGGKIVWAMLAVSP